MCMYVKQTNNKKQQQKNNRKNVANKHVIYKNQIKVIKPQNTNIKFDYTHRLALRQRDNISLVSFGSVPTLQ